jgi:hypothetical protein
MPTKSDIASAARSLRLIADKTAGLPDSQPGDATLQDRLLLAADVLEALLEK